jgi:hypothetical protein
MAFKTRQQDKLYLLPNEPRAMTCRAAIANKAVIVIKIIPKAAAMGICPFCQ